VKGDELLGFNRSLLHADPDLTGKSSCITLFTPKAAIHPPRVNVWTHGPGMHVSPNGPDHSISCLITDIPSHVSGVYWDPAKPKPGHYKLEDGFYNERTNSQVSTLTITNIEIADMLEKIESDTATFTCEIRVGMKKTPVKAEQFITLHQKSDIVLLAMIAIIVLLVLLALLILILVCCRRMRSANKKVRVVGRLELGTQSGH
jgi:hypothetical protein